MRSVSKRRDDSQRLSDIAEAIEKIERWQRGSKHELRKIFEEYGDLYSAAVIRELEVIGEAAHCLSDDFKSGHPEVPWKQIYGFRTHAAHEYWDTRWAIVEGILDEDLPKLRTLVGPYAGPVSLPDVMELARRAAGRTVPGLRHEPARGTCGRRMPISRSYCVLAPGHFGHCRSRR